MSDGAVECTQKGLIKKTLKAAGMEECSPNALLKSCFTGKQRVVQTVAKVLRLQLQANEWPSDEA